MVLWTGSWEELQMFASWISDRLDEEANDVGAEIENPLSTCPACKSQIGFKADLGTVVVMHQPYP